MVDLVRYIKDLEKEFLRENNKLYINSRDEFLRKRDEFISRKLVELKNEKSCEGYTISGDNS